MTTTTTTRTIHNVGEAVRSPVDHKWRIFREMPINTEDFTILNNEEKVQTYSKKYRRPPVMAWVTIGVARKLNDAVEQAKEALL